MWRFDFVYVVREGFFEQMMLKMNHRLSEY